MISKESSAMSISSLHNKHRILAIGREYGHLRPVAVARVKKASSCIMCFSCDTGRSAGVGEHVSMSVQLSCAALGIGFMLRLPTGFLTFYKKCNVGVSQGDEPTKFWRYNWACRELSRTSWFQKGYMMSYTLAASLESSTSGTAMTWASS